jgi:predicted RND superfamily exporter protein
MASSSVRLTSLRIGDFVLRFRAIIGAILLGISAVAIYYCSQVTIRTNFDDFFPSYHPDVQLYQKWHRYGGAQTLSVMIRVRQGDIFNYDTLSKIQGIQREVDKLPGVDHNEVLSIASYRVSFSETTPGSLTIKPFMFPNVPKTKEGVDELRRNVMANRANITQYVSADNKSALVSASFNERGLDYRQFFYQVRDIVKNYEDANNEIFVSGEPMVRGYGYYYTPVLIILFAAALGVMIFILWATGSQRSRWWAPIVTGALSAIWGLGFVGLMGYDFDPVMLVIPFILTARDMSHGIQWQGRYHDELDRLGDKMAACAATTDFMLPPGLLSILADVSGIIFISFGGIPVLQHIALAGTVWLLGSLTMVFIFQPILMSYMGVPEIRHRKARKAARRQAVQRIVDGLEWFVHIPTRPGALRKALLWGSAIFLIYGIVSGLDSKIGYSTPGTPLYKPTAKVNRDIAEVGKYFPLEDGWVILTSPPYPDQQSVVGPNVLRMVTDLRSYLFRDPKVGQVVAFSSTVAQPFNEMFHYGYPKYLGVPESLEMSGNLWFLFLNGSAPGEMERFISNRLNTDTCIRVLLRDHTYDTLNDIRAEVARFVQERVAPDPNLNHVEVHFLAGIAGLYLAANDVLKQLDFLNISFVLAVVWLFCVISFRSFVAGFMFLFACVLANFGAFIYMNARGIGLTIDTIPVISLGIGLGVDYGIYMVSRIRDEVMGGMEVDDAIVLALKSTGVAVFNTFLVMIGGIIPWVFSPLLFHSEMSTLLIFLMATNMMAGVIVLPCYLSWAHPKFVFGGKSMIRERELRAAAS